LGQVRQRRRSKGFAGRDEDIEGHKKERGSVLPKGGGMYDGTRNKAKTPEGVKPKIQ